MKSLLFPVVLSILVLGCSQQKKYHHKSDHFKLVRLADRAYACIHKTGGKAICNVGIVDNGRETIIFDSFITPVVTEELLQLVKGLNLSPVRYVINSHYHNDHIRGNQVFDEDVKIISTRRTAQLIAENEPLNIAYEKEHAPARYRHFDSLYHAFDGDIQSREYVVIQMWRPYYEVLSKSHEEIVTRLPDTFVDDELSLDGPLREVQLITHGGGHTPSDLILYLPEDGIAFTGDLVFNDCHPYLADGDPQSLLSWLNYMQTLDIQRIVPGHGPVGNASELEEMKDYLLTLQDEAQKLMKENRHPDQMTSADIPERFRDWWFERFYFFNLEFLVSRANESRTSG